MINLKPMRKSLFYGGLFVLLMPILVLANPDGIDQYGRHYTSSGAMEYFPLTVAPTYFSGYSKRTSDKKLFYLPQIDPQKLALKTEALIAPLLEKDFNSDIDYCDLGEIFGEGMYTKDSLAGIKPVCANISSIVRSNTKIDSLSYYKELPSLSSEPITKVYHFQYKLKPEGVFTDKPELAELKGWIVQGETDPQMYYVDLVNGESLLRPINIDKATFLFGQNYQEHIIYFDDSIIYSYKLGKSIW